MKLWRWWLLLVALVVVGGWLRSWLTIWGLPLPVLWLAVYVGCLVLPRSQWGWYGLALGLVLELTGWQVLGSSVLFMVVWLSLMSRVVLGLDRWGRTWWWLVIWGMAALGQTLFLVYEAAWVGLDWGLAGKLVEFLWWQVVLLAGLSAGPAWLARGLAWPADSRF